MWGAILAGAGLAMDLFGEFQKGRARKAAAYYNAEVDEADALAAEKETEWAIARHRYEVRKLLGTQHARYAASGVRMEGTPLEVMMETARQAELDTIAMQYKGRTIAARYRSSAGLEKTQGRQAMKGAYFNMAKTLLTSGPGVANQFGWNIG